MSNTPQDAWFNMRAGEYFLAQTIGTCPRCRRATRLVALGLPPGHEVLELDHDAMDEACAMDTWAAAGHSAWMFQVAHLSENVLLRMVETSPAYRLAIAMPAAELQGDAETRAQGRAQIQAQENVQTEAQGEAQTEARSGAQTESPGEAQTETQSDAQTESQGEAYTECHWANHCEHCGAQFDDQELFCEPGGAFFPVSAAAARLILLLPVSEPIAADAAGYAPEPPFFDSMIRS